MGSYRTQHGWVPDPLFSIRLDRVHLLRHGSDSGVYDADGNLQKNCNLEDTFPRASKTLGISPMDILRMRTDHMDIFGWFQSRFEWLLTWALWNRDGYLPWDAAYGQFDGTCFEKRARKISDDP